MRYTHTKTHTHKDTHTKTHTQAHTDTSTQFLTVAHTKAHTNTGAHSGQYSIYRIYCILDQRAIEIHTGRICQPASRPRKLKLFTEMQKAISLTQMQIWPKQIYTKKELILIIRMWLERHFCPNTLLIAIEIEFHRKKTTVEGSYEN